MRANAQIHRAQVAYDLALAQPHLGHSLDLGTDGQPRQQRNGLAPQRAVALRHPQAHLGRASQLPQGHAHGSGQQQRIHLCLPAQNARRHGQSQRHHLFLHALQVPVPLAGKALGQLGGLPQALLAGRLQGGRRLLALGLPALLLALLPARRKGLLTLLVQPRLPLGLQMLDGNSRRG